jgi:chromosomal replication initiation ATPase DnaA
MRPPTDPVLQVLNFALRELNVMLQPHQLVFDLPMEPRFGRDDFLVSPSNAAAWEMFELWPQWPDRLMLLLGPTGAGKSHLSAIWAAHAGVQRVMAPALLDESVVLAGARGLVIENADRLVEAGLSAHQWQQIEKNLFHLINLARSADGFLLFTARQWPDHWGFKVPDLVSRLRLAPVVEIGEPDDALIRAVLVKLFSDRQLDVDVSVVDYLCLRLERSLDAARRIVDILDRQSLIQGRAITRPFAADLLARSMGLDDQELE